MAHDGSRIARLRVLRRADTAPGGAAPGDTAPGGAAPGDAAAAVQEDAQADLVLVHSWLRRCLPVDEAEDLSVAVLARAASPGPACVAAAPRETRLRYLSVQAVLRARGVV